ncbi:MAG: LamG-like jellyroll fold domain-containing protein [Lentisphaeria bacterium]
MKPLYSLQSCILLLSTAFLMANSVLVEPQTILQKQVPCHFTLLLDQPADGACIEFSRGKQDFFLNQKKRLELNATENPKKFTAELIPENLFHPSLRSGSERYDGKILELTGIARRSGQEFSFPAGTPWEKIQMPVILQKAHQVLSGYGKFAQAACFDGRQSIAAVHRMPFHAEEGTLEAWVFLPPLLSQNTGIIAFLQSADGSPWRYHALQVPENSRKIQYLNYSGSSNPPCQAITSKEIYLEEWLYVCMTWSLKQQKMELFVNGESIGTAPYLQPSGGKIADLNLGARIHYEHENYQIISPCLLMLDELRISSVVRSAQVPGKKWTVDDDTLLLIDFDGFEFLTK